MVLKTGNSSNNPPHLYDECDLGASYTGNSVHMAETSGECERGFGCGYFIQLSKFFASLFDVFGYIHQHYEMFVGRIFCRYSAWLKREKGVRQKQCSRDSCTT
ncbi:hypothetical protein [Plesiomonas shigelloides]|uniref:hypothetical protein n=1 Tax=Plesiomonas shigelloides TaxID=703 RepID=UPI0031B7E29E